MTGAYQTNFSLPTAAPPTDARSCPLAHQERLQDVLPLLPQRVPLVVALVAQPMLAKIVQVQEELALLAAQDGGGEGAKNLSAYTAKKLYLLGDSDLRVREDCNFCQHLESV